ncbi:hypothetical protein [Pseudomonas sp. FEN]|uniref:hypothetical protein n=1 Tax=Pseudomonas sp. FEN TaxID=2767468 RepID=UPI0019ABD5F8|nr:hypothetical protein [Pseudomonas sp. FEN]CAD5198677.1 hypothetical protein [Pseudomonas sp. FEN]
MNISWSTIKRHLDDLVSSGKVIREGKARATRYRLADSNNAQLPNTIAASTSGTGPVWSTESKALRQTLLQPLAMRNAVTYQRVFADNYIPNQTSLLPTSLATTLMEEGRMRGQPGPFPPRRNARIHPG